MNAKADKLEKKPKAKGKDLLDDKKVQSEIKRADRTKDVLLPDGGGLYLNLKAISTNVWTLRYVFDGVRRKTTLGNYPKPVTIAIARKKRDDFISNLTIGLNPVEVKRETKKVQLNNETADKRYQDSLFKNVANLWLIKHKDGVCDTHFKKISRSLEKDIFPIIGDKHIDEVLRSDILKIICKLDDSGAGVAARKCLSVIRMVYKHAVTFDIAKHNVAADIDTSSALRKRDVKNFRFIKEPKEVGALLNAIGGYNGDYSTAMALKFLPLVFTRPHNVRSMEWSEINFNTKVWEIPAAKMKMKEAHLVPLSGQALEILKEVQKYNGASQYVFVSSINKRPLSENTLNVALKRIGFGDKMVSHGFRHLASTLLNSNKKIIGVDSEVIERQLAHAERNAMKAVYDHAEYLDERTHLMQWWANFLDGLKNG